MNKAERIEHDVVLLGGGHSHVLLIRRWAMKPMPGVRLTLISSDIDTPYSGMLPGFIAGHYAREDMHIDLLRLCNWASVRFIAATATGLDLEQRQIRLDDGRPPIAFDVLSLDTGSTPDLGVPGAREHVMPVKPISEFAARWRGFEAAAAEAPQRVAVVGSGAGGFELVMAVAEALKNTRSDIHWILRGDTALGERPASVGQRAVEAARSANIAVVTGFDVVRVNGESLAAQDGRTLSVDQVLWVTAASGPDWPRAAGLATDRRGFVHTNDYLQSTSHPFVFASGDIGSHIDQPLPKAGVFAVRQAPVLHDNLRRYLRGRRLKPYRPQRHFLTLLALGQKSAIGNRGSLTVAGDWVWRWKDAIDRKFMRQFQQLPIMPGQAGASSSRSMQQATSEGREPATDMRCRGCGAKLGAQALNRVLATRLPPSVSTQAGDAAVLAVGSETLLQSVDQINAIIDDPWRLGQIAALHALSDISVVEATPHSLQAVVQLADASDEVAARDLDAVLAGINTVLDTHDLALVGGHTSLGSELSLALVVNARLMSASVLSVPTLKAGDALVLTKAIGSGVIFAALQQQKAHGREVESAIASMLQSNVEAATILRRVGATLMTDITGFGLLGHAFELLDATEHGFELDVSDVPWMDGALRLAEGGSRSSLWGENRKIFAHPLLQIEGRLDPAMDILLADPQTGGGLLAVVPSDNVERCLAELHQAGQVAAGKIGQVAERQGILLVNGSVPVSPAESTTPTST